VTGFIEASASSGNCVRREIGKGEYSFALVVLFGLAMVPLLVTPILPLIDLYNHLARFYILAQIETNSFLQDNYQSYWTLIPDIGLDIIAVPILVVVPPLIAGHLIVASILATIFGGVLYFHYTITGQKSLLVAVLVLALSYSYILNWGFISFLLGLGLAFGAAGWWISHRDRPALALPVSCLFALVIYFVHGLAFAFYGVIVLSVELGLALQRPGFWSRSTLRSFAAVTIQALMPVVHFFGWVIYRSRGGDPGDFPPITHTTAHLSFKAQLFTHLIPILRVAESPSYLFDALSVVMVLGAGLLLLRKSHIAIARPAIPLVTVSFLMVFIWVPQLFGVSYISDRIPLFAALCVVGSIEVQSSIWSREARAICAAILLLVTVRVGAVAFSWHSYKASFALAQTIASKIPSHSLVVGIPVGSGYHESHIPRCEMYAPLLVMLHQQAAPLFAYKDQHPLLQRGRLRRASLNTERFFLNKVSDYKEFIEVAATAGFDYQIVCNARLLKQPLPANVAKVWDVGDFMLLRSIR
jgi:hypothetical protein